MTQRRSIKVEHPNPGVKVTYYSDGTVTVQRDCPPQTLKDDNSSPSSSPGSEAQAGLALGLPTKN